MKSTTEMMCLPKACLFDLDGLLIDTEPLHSEAWASAANFFGTTLSEAQLMSLKGRRRHDCANQVDQWLRKPVGAQELLSIQQPIAKKLLRKSKAIPHAESLVRWCSEHLLPMALVTSSSSEAVAFKTKDHKWIELINLKIFGDDTSLISGKPSPDPFLLAAKRLNVSPKDCWAFEDSQAGEKSALDAGCKVWILTQNKQLLVKDSNRSNPRYISQLSNVLEHLKDRS